MSKKILLLVVFLVFSVTLLMAVVDKSVNDETLKCPVSGKEFKKSEVTPKYEYEGKTYYFCCENCKDAFIKDPEKYIIKEEPEGHMHHQMEESTEEHAGHMHIEQDEDVMAVDPVCGMELKKADAKATYEHNGKSYYFCTEECKDKFVKEPGNYIRADEDIVTCPVSGESFNKSEFTESIKYEGKDYYFCCAGCKDKFEKDPEKYAKKEVR
jgi:YHS domain-containing protein